MNENQYIKESLNHIPIPSEKLDAILAEAFPKEKKTFRFPILKAIKYASAAVLVILLFISSAMVSPAVANIVTKIPIIGHAFDYFNSKEEYYQLYDEISTDVGLVEESNGVKLTIEQAFYDGNVVTLSYILNSPDEVDSFPIFEKLPTVNGKFSGGGIESEYVQGVGHLGMMTIETGSHKDTVNISWQPKAISIEDKTFEGKWDFKFSLKAIKGKTIDINEQVNQDGITVRLENAIKTDVNMTINYIQDVDPSVHERWSYVEAEFYAIDNLGNKYKVPYNGGSGIEDGDSSEDMEWNATVHGLDKDATSITFYPFAHVSNTQTDNDRIDFDPITVDLE